MLGEEEALNLNPYGHGIAWVRSSMIGRGSFGPSNPRAWICALRFEASNWEGTPMYLSPEAVKDHVQEAPSDVWGVGCIVHEMLTGKSPLKGKEEELEILRKIGEGREVIEIDNIGVSKEAKEFLKGCFVRNYYFRFTCEMLLLHPFLQGLVVLLLLEF